MRFDFALSIALIQVLSVLDPGHDDNLMMAVVGLLTALRELLRLRRVSQVLRLMWWMCLRGFQELGLQLRVLEAQRVLGLWKLLRCLRILRRLVGKS